MIKGGIVIKLSIIILILVLSLILGTQAFALFVQYKTNRGYSGIGWWLLGSSLMALGFILMPLVSIKSLEKIAGIGNPLFVLGHIFLYTGIKRFLGKKINKWIPIWVFLVFNLFYYYFMYIKNDVSVRTVIINIAIAIISLMIAYELFLKKDRFSFGTANFTAAVFFGNGCFSMVRIFQVSMMPSVQSYVEQGSILIGTLIFTIVISNLWTFGLINMVNERLNIDHQLEKEKLQLIFNTNLDAQLITRLSDGFIVDVNDEFSLLSGHLKDELIGKSVEEIDFWHNPEDRQSFVSEIEDKGIYENMEFVFQRKDNSKFPGIISARIIIIHSVPHIISVIRNIIERKQFEAALMESEEKYRSVLNASPDDITITDLEGRIVMISPAANAMFGYEPDFDNFRGMQLLDFIVPEDVERAKYNIQQMYQGTRGKPNEYRGVRKDQSIFDIEVNSGFVHNPKGPPDKMVFIIRDISERKQIEFKM